MSDLISRVLILRELERIAEIHPYKVIGDRDSYSPYNEAWEDCISLIEERLQFLPSAEPKWIPVTEALPEEKEMVLITNNKGHVRCGQYRGTFADKNYRWWWKNNTLEEVLAWMPLPEAWRGE